MRKITYADALLEKVCREREQLKQGYMDKQPEEIYEDWYKISFYESYYEMFMSDFIDHRIDIIEWLCGFENPLAFLYSEWLSADGPFSHNWDEMVSFIEEVYEEEN